MVGRVTAITLREGVRDAMDEFNKVVPNLISWNVTARCGLSCPHCYINARPAGGPPELDTAQGLELIDEVAELNPSAMLVLSGGEPLLRPDLSTLARRAAGKGMMVVVGTSGVYLDEEMVKTLISCGVAGVGVSLDSAHPAEHDRFRGLAGAWQRTVQGILACGRHGLPVQVQTTVTAVNYKQLPEVMELAYNLGAKVFNLFFLVCTGRGQSMTDISAEQYEETLRWLAQTRGNYRGMMVRARCAPHLRRLAVETDPGSPLLLEDGSRCLAATSYCRILPDGTVTPCPYLPLSAGNIRDRGFAWVWRNSPLLRGMRRRVLQGRCGRCEYEGLCGGCRARAYALKGSYTAEDPLCAYQPGHGKPRTAAGGAALCSNAMNGRTKAADNDFHVTWSPEAEEFLQLVPAFVRNMVRTKVEGYLRQKGETVVRLEHLKEARQRMAMLAGNQPRHTEQAGAGVLPLSKSPGHREGAAR